MKLPGWSTDVDKGKQKLAERYEELEKRILNECSSLGTSGFADKRIAANAYAKFEEAFLLLRKALRIADENPDPNEYGKVAVGNPDLPASFTPRTDPFPSASSGDYDADGNLRLTRDG